MTEDSIAGVVRCEYEMTQSEAEPILRWIARRRPSLVLLKVTGTVAIGVGIAKLAAGGTPVVEGSTFIYGGIMLGWVMTEILVFRGARASFRLRTLARHHRVEFSNRGMEVWGPAVYHRLWVEVKAITEHLGAYVISFGMNRVLIIPRSAFELPSTEVQFRKLASQHVKPRFQSHPELAS